METLTCVVKRGPGDPIGDRRGVIRRPPVQHLAYVRVARQQVYNPQEQEQDGETTSAACPPFGLRTLFSLRALGRRQQRRGGKGESSASLGNELGLRGGVARVNGSMSESATLLGGFDGVVTALDRFGGGNGGVTSARAGSKNSSGNKSAGGTCRSSARSDGILTRTLLRAASPHFGRNSGTRRTRLRRRQFRRGGGLAGGRDGGMPRARPS